MTDIFCPACDRSYSSDEKLIAHLKAALVAGDDTHIDVVDLEEWDLNSATPLADDNG